MSANLIDTDTILSENEQWVKLEKQWGDPIDLETDEDPPNLSPVFSSLDLRKTTFDSSFILKKVGRKWSKNTLDYSNFLQDLQRGYNKDPPKRQFYFINGQIISAYSVEEICTNIDELFKSVEKLCSATSTVRFKKLPVPMNPEVVHCSISDTDLSFDDTKMEKEKSDNDVDRYIDEVFENFNTSMANLSKDDGESMKDTVTTLVKKFTSFLNNPSMVCSPRKKRDCCAKFKDLTEFWQNRVTEAD